MTLHLWLLTGQLVTFELEAVVLCLKKLEFILDSVTWVWGCKLQLLWWSWVSGLWKHHVSLLFGSARAKQGRALLYLHSVFLALLLCPELALPWLYQELSTVSKNAKPSEASVPVPPQKKKTSRGFTLEPRARKHTSNFRGDACPYRVSTVPANRTAPSLLSSVAKASRFFKSCQSKMIHRLQCTSGCCGGAQRL